MPCSCSRCTNRSRVRAEVIPMPLRRGSSMKLLKRKPTLEFGQRHVPRQIDLQRRDGGKALRDRVKVRARSRILALARGSDPIHIAAARVLGAHDRFAAMARTEPRHSNPAQLTVQEVRNVHVEYHRSLQGL